MQCCYKLDSIHVCLNRSNWVIGRKQSFPLWMLSQTLWGCLQIWTGLGHWKTKQNPKQNKTKIWASQSKTFHSLYVPKNTEKFHILFLTWNIYLWHITQRETVKGEVVVIRTINQSSYSCFLTFLQIVVEKLMKVRSVMVSSMASGKYDSVSISN